MQTLTFGGTVTSSTASTFNLVFNGATTPAITYSSVTTTLQAAIQNALNGLSSLNFGGQTANTTTLVSAVSATSVTITFQNAALTSLLADTNVPTMTVISNLAGTNPTASVATTTAGVAAVTVAVGGFLTLDNTLVNLSNRFTSTGTISLDGGTLTYIGNNTAGVVSTQSFGVITLGQGANSIVSQNGSGANSANYLSSTALFRSVGSTVSFIAGNGAVQLGTGYNTFVFTNAPVLSGASGTAADSILPYASINLLGSTTVGYATYIPVPANPVAFGAYGISTFENYVTSLANATSTSNVELNAGTTLPGNKVVNSLLLIGTLTLTVGSAAAPNTLTVASGAIMASAAGTATIAGGTLDFGTTEGLLEAGNTTVAVATQEGDSSILNGSAITITSSITGSGGLTASGAGAVSLNGTGVFTGPTTYDGGALDESDYVTGELILGSVSSIGNNSLTAISGSFGPSVGGTFAVLINAITLDNSIVGFGISATPAARPTFAGPITIFGNNTIEAPYATTYIAGAISGPGSITVGETGDISVQTGASTAVALEGNNTYSGGTIFDPFSPEGITTEVVVTNSNAFGTGPINWLGGEITTARILGSTGPTVEAGGAAISFSNQLNLVNSTIQVDGPFEHRGRPGQRHFRRADILDRHRHHRRPAGCRT